MSVYDKLKELNITLPPVSVPAAAYVPYVQTGNLVFLSGHIARKDGKPWAAQFGRDIGTEEGKQAARAVAIDLMGTLQAASGGDLGKVRSVSQVNVGVIGDGTAIELRVPIDPDVTSAPMRSQADWTAVASIPKAVGTAVMKLDEPVNTRYLLVYLTSLPPESGNYYQGGIGNIEVRG